jgi:dihydrofolate synthase/folylpolyglutamate synthase
MVSDKEHDKILNLLPKSARYYFCKPNVPRGLDAEILISKAQNFNLQGNVYKSVKSALKAAQSNAMQNDLVLVGGSTFVVAEAL